MSLLDNDPAVEILDGNMALQAVDRAQIDIQISTARAYPRDLGRCQRDALALATLDQETAKTMFYAVPRDGKTIKGPSIRLAEVIANSWEHIRVEARVDSIEEKFLTATATAMDLQKNFAVRTSVRRRITTKAGKRYNDDMIVTASNAACSIAMRNALFKVVPFAFVRPVYDHAMKVAIGDAKSFVANRDKMIDTLAKSGVPVMKVLAFFGYETVDGITADDLIVIRGALNALREGELTVEDAFSNGAPEPNAEVLKPTTGADQSAAASAPADTASNAPAAPEVAPY